MRKNAEPHESFPPMPPPLALIRTRNAAGASKGVGLATVVLAAVVASATWWLPLYTIDSGQPGPQPNVPLVQASGVWAVAGAVALCGPLLLAVVLLAAVWAGWRALALTVAVSLTVWTVGGFFTTLIGGITAPVAVLGMGAALLIPARTYEIR